MSHNLIPRVAAIHDLSGIGRCSLAVIIPVLSAMGVQVCPMPTSVLSTHTGGYDHYTFNDLTEDMRGFIHHWKELNEEFDCFYSGFVGSPEQMDLMKEFISDFSMEDKLIVIDPVFADNGELYSTFDTTIVDSMRDFVSHAHIITPNLTEACFLANESMPSGKMSLDAIKNLILKLADLGPETIVITGVNLEDHKQSVIAYDKKDHRFFKTSSDLVPVQYPGTGDIFTSVMIGALLQGDPLAVAVDRATQFVAKSILMTYAYNSTPREGVLLEKMLPSINASSSSINYEIL